MNYGGSQSFTVTPNTGYHIDSVVVDGVNQGAVTGHNFTNVTANHTIDAYFSINVYTITATASAGGSITRPAPVNVNYGANQSFTITPNTGYHIDSVVVDGVNQGAVTSHTFTNVTTNHTIDGVLLDQRVHDHRDRFGRWLDHAVRRRCSVELRRRTSPFTISPNAGYHIDSVVVDGVNLGAVAAVQLHERHGEPHDRRVLLDQ